MGMVFIAGEPGWKCKNIATCPFNKTINLGGDKYSFRCDIPRKDWEFADDFTSIVTEVFIPHREGRGVQIRQLFWCKLS